MNKKKVEEIGMYRQGSRGIYKLLQDYSDAGCLICLDGKEAAPEKIATACLQEGNNYMMDFITEGRPPSETERRRPGRIIRIDFTSVGENHCEKVTGISDRHSPSFRISK